MNGTDDDRGKNPVDVVPSLKTLDERALEVLGLEDEEAKQAGALGYMARVFTQVGLPHSEVAGSRFIRRNGNFTLTIAAIGEEGLPFGSIPRLLLSWVTTEAVRTGSPVLELGPTLSAFMAEIGISSNTRTTGGKKGSITRFRSQTMRLFASAISVKQTNEAFQEWKAFNIAEDYALWWNPKMPDQATLWTSTVTLSAKFFQSIMERPVPVDLRALRLLKRSPLALDIYCWLTHRMFYLKEKTEVPWSVLQLQFGADYSLNSCGPRDFKKKFLLRLKKVCEIYPQAKVEPGEKGLILKPSPPHVAPIPPEKMSAAERKRRVLVVKRAETVHERIAAELTGNLWQDETSPLPPPRVWPPPLVLQTETYEKAKRATRGQFDVYALEQEWREWIAKKNKVPDDPDGAFIGFCAAKYKQMNK